MSLTDCVLKYIQLNIDKVKILEEIKEYNKLSETFDGLVSYNSEINRLKFKLEVMEKISNRYKLFFQQYY